MTSNSTSETPAVASPWSIVGIASFVRRHATLTHGAKSTDNTAPVNSKVKRLIAIQWAQDSLEAALIERSADEWKLERELSVAAPVGEPCESLGDELRQALADSDIAASHAVVSVPLTEVVLKRFSLHSVSEAQLSDAVRLQAEARGIAQERYVVDFEAHPSDAAQEWDVCLAALPKAVMQAIELVVETAGLNLKAVGVGEMALARSLSIENDTTHYLAICDSHEVQLVASAAGLTLATSQFGQPDNPFGLPRLLTANITRMSQALSRIDEPKLVSEAPIPLTVIGDNAEAVVEAYSGQSDIAAELLQPKPGAQTASVGLLPAIELARQATATGTLVNFVAPKQSVDFAALRREQQKRWLIRGGLVAALLLMLVRSHISKLDEQVRTLSAANRTQTTAPEQHEFTIEKAMQLSQWIGDRTHWSVELKDILAHLPTNDRAFVRSIRAEHSVGRAPNVRLEGLAREIDDAIALNQSLLRNAPQLEIRPDEIGHHADETYYRARFVVSASLRRDGGDNKSEAN